MPASDSNGTDAQILGIAIQLIEQLKIRDLAQFRLVGGVYRTKGGFSAIPGSPPYPGWMVRVHLGRSSASVGFEGRA